MADPQTQGSSPLDDLIANAGIAPTAPVQGAAGGGPQQAQAQPGTGVTEHEISSGGGVQVPVGAGGAQSVPEPAGPGMASQPPNGPQMEALSGGGGTGQAPVSPTSPAPVPVTAAPAAEVAAVNPGMAQPQPMSKKEKKELEKKAKQVIKELDGLQEKPGGGNNKGTSKGIKAAIVVLAIMVVGAGTWVGIQLLGQQGTQEIRTPAIGARFTCTQQQALQQPACLNFPQSKWEDGWCILIVCPFGDTNGDSGCNNQDRGAQVSAGHCFNTVLPQASQLEASRTCYQLDAVISQSDNRWCHINETAGSICTAFQDNLDTCVAQTAATPTPTPQTYPVGVDFTCTRQDAAQRPACLNFPGSNWNDEWCILITCPYGDTNGDNGCNTQDRGATAQSGNCFDTILPMVTQLDSVRTCYQFDTVISRTDHRWCQLTEPPSICTGYQDNLDTCIPVTPTPTRPGPSITPTRTPTRAPTPTRTRTPTPIPTSALGCRLTASPSSGTAPVNNVNLQGFAVNNRTDLAVTYRFDCTNNGGYEQNMSSSQNPFSYTGCSYATPGTYTARLRVEQSGRSAECTTPISVSAAPSVTPTPALACTLLQFSSNTPNLGDTLTLTCSGTPTNLVGYAQFQMSRNGSNWLTLPNATNTSARMTVSEIGHYEVRCRVCTNNSLNQCSPWQGATTDG